MKAPWQALGGVALGGYEIHHGQTRVRADMQVAAQVPAQELLAGMLWQGGNPAVIGTYLHGMFENASLIHALFGHDAPSLDQVFERLAQGVSHWFDKTALPSIKANL